jgi:hypothetical protein
MVLLKDSLMKCPFPCTGVDHTPAPKLATLKARAAAGTCDDASTMAAAGVVSGLAALEDAISADFTAFAKAFQGVEHTLDALPNTGGAIDFDKTIGPFHIYGNVQIAPLHLDATIKVKVLGHTFKIGEIHGTEGCVGKSGLAQACLTLKAGQLCHGSLHHIVANALCNDVVFVDVFLVLSRS